MIERGEGTDVVDCSFPHLVEILIELGAGPLVLEEIELIAESAGWGKWRGLLHAQHDCTKTAFIVLRGIERAVALLSFLDHFTEGQGLVELGDALRFCEEELDADRRRTRD